LKFLVFYLKWMVNRKLQNSEMLKFTVLLKQNWTGHNFGEWILFKNECFFDENPTSRQTHPAFLGLCSSQNGDFEGLSSL